MSCCCGWLVLVALPRGLSKSKPASSPPTFPAFNMPEYKMPDFKTLEYKPYQFDTNPNRKSLQDDEVKELLKRLHEGKQLDSRNSKPC